MNKHHSFFLNIFLIVVGYDLFMRFRESGIGEEYKLLIGFLMTKQGIGSIRAVNILLGLTDDERKKLFGQIKGTGEYSEYLSLLKKNRIEVVDSEGELYKKRFGELKYRPAVLFCRGNIGLMSRTTVAVVGSRNCDQYGVNATRRIVEQVAKCKNIALVTGLATGIDSVALEEARKYAVPTISVIAGGHKIFSKINNDLIISEYPPANKLSKGHFIIRNRLIASLADVVIVAQAGEKSGALYTAEYAKQCNKLLFAVPGQMTDYRFIGCNRLISNGANIVDWEGNWLHKANLVGVLGDQENLLERVLGVLIDIQIDQKERINQVEREKLMVINYNIYDEKTPEESIIRNKENDNSNSQNFILKCLFDSIIKDIVSSKCQENSKCSMLAQRIIEKNTSKSAMSIIQNENKRKLFLAVALYCQQNILQGQGLSFEEICCGINEFRRDEIRRYLTKLEVGGILRQNLIGKYVLC